MTSDENYHDARIGSKEERNSGRGNCDATCDENYHDAHIGLEEEQNNGRGNCDRVVQRKQCSEEGHATSNLG